MKDSAKVTQLNRKTQAIPALDPVVVWRNLKYEADMFIALKKRRSAGPVESDLQFALIEVELLHVRVLCSCLLDKREYGTDVILADVMKGVRDQALVDAIADLDTEYGDKNDDKRLRWQINKFVAHFTLHRKTAADYEPLLAHIEPKLQTVLECLAKAKQCPWTAGLGVIVPKQAQTTGSTNASP